MIIVRSTDLGSWFSVNVLEVFACALKSRATINSSIHAAFLEKNISDHYMACRCFLFQCRAVAKRLAIAEKSRETLTDELKLAHQNITRLQVLTDVFG